MPQRLLPLLLALLVAIVPVTARASAQDVPAAMRAHVAWLADDAREGREAGTTGFDAAAAYVFDAFRRAGLRTARQPVPLVTATRAWAGRIARTAAGETIALVPGEDFVAAPDPSAPLTRITAPMVFVGRGVTAPSLGIDDYAGVATRGRIVAFIGGTPPGLGNDERAWLGSLAAKLQAAAAHGAVGAILLTGAGDGASLAPWTKPRTTWARADGLGQPDAPGVPLLAATTDDGSAQLFDGAVQRWDAMLADAAAGRPLRAQPLPGTFDVETHTAFRAFSSGNVLGVIEGADPALRREVVVLSAHLDHIGVTAEPDARGDRINNGALDDAIGIATLIEVARRFRQGARPRRTIVFLATTAEEKGLVGADWFVAHRPPGLEDVVANVNLDMPVLTYDFTDVIAFGGDRSTLGGTIAAAAAQEGVTVSPDPIPDQAIFIRSDHFRFVAAGIPAVFLWPGHANGGKAALDDFLAHRYHRSGDEVTQAIRWDQAARFVDLNWRITHAIAQADARPTWRTGDYFGVTFANGPRR